MKSMMDARKKMLDDRIASSGSGSSAAMDATKEARLLERSQHVVDTLRGALNTRCTEDKWPADVLGCLGTVKKREDIQACIGKLPKDLSDKATAEIMKTMSTGLNMRMRPNNGGAMIMGSAHGGPLTGAVPPPPDNSMPVPARTPSTPPPSAPAPAPAAPAPAAPAP